MALIDNLVSYYKLDETSGTTAGDAHSTNDGTANNARVFTSAVAGKINTGADFTQGNDFITIGNDTSVQLTSGTISAWVNGSNFGTNYRGIVIKQFAYGLFAIDNKLGTYDWGGAAQRNTGVAINTSKWIHIVMTFESGTSLKFYINGSNVMNTTMSVLHQDKPLEIGRGYDNAEHITGYVDEVGIWSRALTSDEVSALYNNGDGLSYSSMSYSDTKIRTRLLINNVRCDDALNMKLTKSGGNANLSSNIEIAFDSPYGKNKDRFNINEEIVLYCEKSNAIPTNRLFSGVIEKIKFSGKEINQKVTISGRDYSLRLQDMTVEPIVFNNTEISQIVTNILTNNNVPDITTNNINTTTITLPRIRYNHDSIFDALNQLAELANYNWYIDTDKDLHFEQKKTISSGYTLNSQTNILSSDFDKSRQGMANRIWVYGDRYLSGFTEKKYIGSPTGQSGLTLFYKPHNTEVTYLGSSYKGGIFGMTTAPVSGINYLVDYDSRTIIFQSGTEIGYNSIPISGGSVIVNYQRELPIVKFGQDDTSIRLYGPKNFIIQDEKIKDPNFALSVLKNKLQETTPLNRLKLNLHGWFNFNPGNTIDVVMDEFAINEDEISIIQIDYKFDSKSVLSENVISVTLSKKFLDITDQIKSLSERLNALESKNVSDSDVVTRLLISHEQFNVVGSHWNIYARTNLGSSFILGKGYHGITGPTFSGILGSIIASGINFLGDSRNTLSLQFSGGNNYSITGSYDLEAPENGGRFGILWG